MANLTTKELTAIEDQLGLEQMLIKKYHSVAGMTSDPQLKSKCEQIASKHQQHYDKLLTHLN